MAHRVFEGDIQLEKKQRALTHAFQVNTGDYVFVVRNDSGEISSKEKVDIFFGPKTALEKFEGNAVRMGYDARISFSKEGVRDTLTLTIPVSDKHKDTAAEFRVGKCCHGIHVFDTGLLSQDAREGLGKILNVPVPSAMVFALKK